MIADGTVLLSSEEAHEIAKILIGGEKIIILIMIIIGIVILINQHKIKKMLKEIRNSQYEKEIYEKARKDINDIKEQLK